MKKTLALLLCFAMLFTALSVNVFAAEEPTAKVTVVANSPDSSSRNVTFAVKLSGFDSLKGLDLIINGKGLTFGDTVTTKNVGDPLTEDDTTYTVSPDEIHIVELTLVKNEPVIISGSATLDEDATAPKITVTACELAKNGEALYAVDTEYTFNNEAAIASVINQKPVEVGDKTTIQQSDAGEGYFIPYGGVANDGESVKKEKDGSFKDITEKTNVLKFPKPANGITTFGVSASTVETSPAKQFGTYVANYDPSAKQYGSMVLVGDWDAFVKAYIKNHPDAYISEIVAKLYDFYEEYNPNRKYDYVEAKITDGGIIKSVRIFKVQQYNYMWKNEDEKILEYAVRVFGLEDNTTYTSVAYNADIVTGENPVFSAAIKSEAYAK